MIADRDLLEHLMKVFSTGHHVASATGKVLPKWEADPPKWILKYCCNEWLSLNMRGENLVIAPFDIGVFSCHQAILKEAFLKSGGFNPENTAGEWIGDGETGLNLKLRDLGYHFAFTGDSVIYHMIPSSRMTQGYLNKRLANQGNCDSYANYRKHRHSRAQLMVNEFRYAADVGLLLLKLAPRVILERDAWRMTLARIFYYLSRMKYDMRLLRDEQWRELVLRVDWLDE
jgi:hypothetical protein